VILTRCLGEEDLEHNAHHPNNVQYQMPRMRSNELGNSTLCTKKWTFSNQPGRAYDAQKGGQSLNFEIDQPGRAYDAQKGGQSLNFEIAHSSGDECEIAY